MLNACARKYVDLNIDMVKKSLLFHDDIILSPIEFIGAEVDWPKIAQRLKNAYENPHKIFGKF